MPWRLCVGKHTMRDRARCWVCTCKDYGSSCSSLPLFCYLFTFCHLPSWGSLDRRLRSQMLLVSSMHHFISWQNDVSGFLLQTIYLRGFVLKEFSEEICFFRVPPFLLAEPLFRHHCWWDTPKGYANTTCEIRACGLRQLQCREIPMHASFTHAPHHMYTL